ncbi:MAG TPA: hypothetical protein ENN13_01515 [Candidatus Altiarchaeales archaeon]|nr:hypothetical protein [Candidatus Altiarchaeales archaeon]
MLKTTVIGSFPVKTDSGYYSRKYLEKKPESPYPKLIRDAVDAQVEAGIDIVSDGQTRSDFVSLYAKGFSGILLQERPQVFSKIRCRGPITVADQEYVKKTLPEKTMLKGIVTGPYTLAKSCVNHYYDCVEDLAFDFAEGLREEVKALCRTVDFIQVDEPMMTVEYPDYGRELISKVFKSAKKPRMLHACGDVSKVFENFIEFPVDFLEHEFKANPALLDTVSQYDFRQKIGYGCVRSDLEEVETVGEIVGHVEAGIKKLGIGNIILCPDCGMRNLPPESAGKKLENMVLAKNILEEKWGK